MTYQHELECPCFPDFEWKECACDSISRAYLRGREDAAKAIMQIYGKEIENDVGGTYVLVNRTLAVSAARVESE